MNEDENEIDALLADFQAACEECVQRSNHETTMNRAILRNALRVRLLDAVDRASSTALGPSGGPQDEASVLC